MRFSSHPTLRCISKLQPSISSRRIRGLHSTSPNRVISKFTMPAMSPTMTEGGIAAWKVKDGQSFSAGDVLLEIETDKATMDVEAQEDGVMGKIIIQDGAKEIAVGKTIAMLAEEGDDISNIKISSEETSTSSSKPSAPSSSSPESQSKPSSSSSPSPSPPSNSSTSSTPSTSSPNPLPSQGHGSHSSSSPMFPSVSRLLSENNVSSQDASKIKGTGVRGMLTKGDVLTFLGVVEKPTGSFKEVKNGISNLGGGSPVKSEAKKSEPLTPSSLRSLILSGLSSSSSSARSRSASGSPVAGASKSGIDELISDYEFGNSKKAVGSKKAAGRKDGFEGLI